MDMQTIKPIVDEVLTELGIDGKQVQVETAVGAPKSEAVQIRIADASGKSKSVVVDLRDKEGRAMNDDEIRQRVREQLATFKEITLH